MKGPIEITRYLIALLFAAVITYGLFFTMYQLTKSSGLQFMLPSYNSLRLDFIRLKQKEIEVEQKRHLPEKLNITRQPLLPSLPQQNISVSPQLDNFSFSLPALPQLRSGLNVNAFGTADITPLVRVQPIYPIRAQSRGIEGWVEIEFSIDKTGKVLNPRVIEADPKGIFERVTLKAVSRWRYQPQVIAGEAVRRDQVRVFIDFKLE